MNDNQNIGTIAKFGHPCDEDWGVQTEPGLLQSAYVSPEPDVHRNAKH